MSFNLAILQFTVSVISALGIGGCLKWLLSIEHRITIIETRCGIISMRKNEDCGMMPAHKS